MSGRYEEGKRPYAIYREGLLPQDGFRGGRSIDMEMKAGVVCDGDGSCPAFGLGGDESFWKPAFQQKHDEIRNARHEIEIDQTVARGSHEGKAAATCIPWDVGEDGRPGASQVVTSGFSSFIGPANMGMTGSEGAGGEFLEPAQDVEKPVQGKGGAQADMLFE